MRALLLPIARLSPRVLIIAVATFIVAASTGCVSKRTVREGGRVVEQKYVFRAPLLEAFQSSGEE